MQVGSKFVDDPAFALKEFAAPEGCATDDRDGWRIGNPALSCKNPFLAEDGMEAARRTVREPVFRQLRLGQWVTGAEAWMPFGAWDDCRTDRVVCPRERVVLAFDGSASGDSTALVGCTLARAHRALCRQGNPDGRPRVEGQTRLARKIDAAVAAIVAYDRAAFHQTKTHKRARGFAS